MKRKVIFLAILLFILTACNFRKLDINSVLDESNFKGLVVEISSEWVYVKVIQPDEEQIVKIDEVYQLPKEPQLKDTMMEFEINQTVQIYFEKNAVDNHIFVIETVYAYNLLDPLE